MKLTPYTMWVLFGIQDMIRYKFRAGLVDISDDGYFPC
jgi:hypothetical protein